MLKIKVGDFQIGKEEKQAINRVLDSGKISEGVHVSLFEKEWADYIGTKFSVATSSGTGALITGLTALKYRYKLPMGTKVITTPVSYIATANAISSVGFEPVFVDIDPITFGITPGAIENHLRKTKNLKEYKVIVPIDLFGFPVQIDKMMEIAKKYHMFVLEDASQAEGTVYQGKKVGCVADLATYSFYIAHNIQAGEMGALVTNDKALDILARKIKANGRLCSCHVCTRSLGHCPLKNNKKDPRFYHEYIGYNFKPMEFSAVLARYQLKRVDKIIKKRQANVLFLNNKLNKYKKIFQLPPYSSDVSYLAYPLILRKPKVISRQRICSLLESMGVETRPIFPCIPTQQPAYKYLANEYRGKLPQAEYISENGFYIGCHQYLEREDLNYLIEVFDKILTPKLKKLI